MLGFDVADNVTPLHVSAFPHASGVELYYQEQKIGRTVLFP